jgi:hypothetical protein
MTVMDEPDHEIGGQILCSWFASDNKRMTEFFPPNSLERAERT